MRVVSLVPSLTHTVAAMGRADLLVGVTDYCVRGAPAAAARVGGTKHPSLGAIRSLRPDLVLANREENRAEDVEQLRADGVEVLVTFPRTVAQVPGMLRLLGARIGADVPADRLAGQVDAALARAGEERPSPPVPVLTLVWRKPWMAVGAGTYVDDLLGRCGFANVATGLPGRYPRLQAGHGLRPLAVLLPSEPYAFGPADLEAVTGLVGTVAYRFVDGERLTWHGPHTVEALPTFTALAGELRAEHQSKGATK